MTNSIPKGSETMTNGTHSNSHPRSEADLNAWESEAYSKSLPEGPNGQNPSQSAGADLTCTIPTVSKSPQAVLRKCSKTNQTASESNISKFPSSRLLFQVEPTPSLSLAAPARSMGGGGRTESPRWETVRRRSWIRSRATLRVCQPQALELLWSREVN